MKFLVKTQMFVSDAMSRAKERYSEAKESGDLLQQVIMWGLIGVAAVVIIGLIINALTSAGQDIVDNITDM